MIRRMFFAAALACATLLPVAGPAAAQEHVFRLGVINERPDRPDFALEQYGAFREYLEAKLAPRGIRVENLVIAQSVREMAGLLSAGKVDGLLEGVFPTLTLEQRTSALEPALLAWRKGQRQYHTVFFVRKDSEINGLKDLAGRTIAFEAPRSTSAFAMPLAQLRSRGIRTEPVGTGTPAANAVRYSFAGSEVNQAYWVTQKKTDAAAFNDGDWERLPAPVRRQLRIIERTPPVLRWIYSFHKSVPPAIRAAVTKTLLHMHEDARAAEALKRAEHIARFERLTGADLAALGHWRQVHLRSAPAP